MFVWNHNMLLLNSTTRLNNMFSLSTRHHSYTLPHNHTEARVLAVEVIVAGTAVGIVKLDTNHIWLQAFLWRFVRFIIRGVEYANLSSCLTNTHIRNTKIGSIS